MLTRATGNSTGIHPYLIDLESPTAICSPRTAIGSVRRLELATFLTNLSSYKPRAEGGRLTTAFRLMVFQTPAGGRPNILCPLRPEAAMDQRVGTTLWANSRHQGLFPAQGRSGETGRNMPTFGLAGSGSGVRQTCDVAISLNVFRQEPILVPYEARVCPFLQLEPGRVSAAV